MKSRQSPNKIGRFLWSFRKISCICLVNLGSMFLFLVGAGMAYSLFAPFFPTQAQRKGMTPSMVGVLFGSYQLVMLVGTPVCSKLLAVDHCGLKFMIGSGTLLAAGCTILFGVLDYSPNGLPYIVLCFALRIFEAIGSVLYLTAAYCLAGKIFPKKIAFVYSVLETANGFGGMIGPSVGGFLYETAGFFLPFVSLGAMFLLFGIITTLTLSSSKNTSSSKPPMLPKNAPSKSNISWLQLFRLSTTAWIITFAETTAAILSNYPEPTISIYFEKLGLDDKTIIGSFFLAASLVYTFSCIIVGYLADKLPTKCSFWMMTSGAIWTSLSFLLMGPAPFLSSFIEPSIAITATSSIVLYGGIALLIIPVPSILSNLAKRHYSDNNSLATAAMVAGLYNSVYFLGGFIGPIVAGFLLETVGFQWGAIVMSASSLSLIPLLLFCAIKNHENTTIVTKRQQPITNNDNAELLTKTNQNETTEC